MTGRVCIIGAGISGLTTAKALLDKGIEFDLYEKESSFAGVWLYKEDARKFSIYKSCHAIASKRFMAFADLPISDEYTDYMSHQNYLKYIKEYVAKYKLAEHIALNTTVTNVSKSEIGEWSVTIVKNGETDTLNYEHVVVATGHFHTPRYPDCYREQSEVQLHSAFYRTPDPYRKKNVLVVGLGNSGADIACDLVPEAENVTLSTRRSAHVFPKYILGKPFLEYTTPFDDHIPFPIRQLMTRFLLWLGRGNVQDYGLPKPNHEILIKNPVISPRLLDSIHCGDIKIRPGVRSIEGANVTFDDGSVEAFDNIILATGYKVHFPFFDIELIDFTAGKFSNFMGVVNLQHKNLYFVGLIELLGALPPVIELQGKLVAEIVSGGVKLPSREKMEKQAQKLDKKMRSRFQLTNSDEPVIKAEVNLYQKQIKRFLA